MDLFFDEDYPIGAAFGADFFTGAARGDIIEDGPDGPIVRPERVLVTSRDLDYEGRVCVGERTVRHLAHSLDMIDKWRVDAVVADNRHLREELVELSALLASAREQNRLLRELEAAPPIKVYLSLDSTEHASSRGAIEQSAKVLGVETKTLIQARPSLAADTVELP